MALSLSVCSQSPGLRDLSSLDIRYNTFIQRKCVSVLLIVPAPMNPPARTGIQTPSESQQQVIPLSLLPALHALLLVTAVHKSMINALHVSGQRSLYGALRFSQSVSQSVRPGHQLFYYISPWLQSDSISARGLL